MNAAAFDVPALLARLGAFPRRIVTDSRRIEAGVAFAAYPGTRADGRAFVPDAIARGASAVLWDSDGFSWDARWQVPNAPLPGLQARMGAIADFIYGSPSRSLWMVGVTGTNGKTSCAHWIAQAFERVGRRTGIVGTLGNGFAAALAPAAQTTPDVAELHEMLRQFRDAGAQSVAMEVSSHGLEQGRVNGIKFDVALFTNLSRDHLDYHRTMAAYGAAKARLLAWPGLRCAVINADDPFGQSLIDTAHDCGQKVLTYGLASADIVASGMTIEATGITLEVATPWGAARLTAPVAGAFNAQNILGVLAVLLASDVALDDAVAALAKVTAPPGRMQRITQDGAPLVVVDYAHSPDALEKVLASLKPAVASGGELVCVFGCGGDRDPGKRPQMGQVAARMAQRIVVTSDNPRSEDPGVIANAVVRGVRDEGHRRWSIELDRRTAIRSAVASAKPGDVVLIAGKGHETWQEVAGLRSPFADAVEAREALALWRAA